MAVKKKIKTTVFFVLIFIFFLGGLGLSYDNLIVHPKLTEEAIGLYNREYPEKDLSQQQKDWIVQGAIAEDTDPRYLNHFYNPKTGEGLNDGGTFGRSAKKYAYDQENLLGDYSIPKTLENYKEGNKKRAYQGVGHILHLIQDMSVPAHVRNDAHPPPEGDPYENWTKKHNPIYEDDLRFIEVDDIKNVFDSLAGYTHNNFYSKKDIEKGKINIGGYEIKEERDIYGEYTRYVYKDNYKLIKVGKNLKGKEYSLVFRVHHDYWNQLHPKAIGYSAGVIDYFQKEFQKIDKNKQEKDILTKLLEYPGNVIDQKFYAHGDLLLATGKTVGATWETTKESAKTGAYWTKLYAVSFKEVVVDSTEYAAGKAKDAWNQTYDQIAIWQEDETQPSGSSSDDQEPQETPEKETSDEEEEEEQKVLAEKQEDQPQDQTKTSKNLQKEPRPQEQEPEMPETQPQEPDPKPGQTVGVKFVYDGDSILLENGQEVRYIGLDTPELNDSGKQDDECLAWEAKVRNMELLDRGEVRIVKDPAVNKDKYDRLLRYVYVGDELLNKTLVREGLAEPFFCQPGWENCPVTRDGDKKQTILQAHDRAQAQNLGLFSGVCEQEQKEKVAEKEEKKVKGDKEEEDTDKETNKDEEDQEEDKKYPLHILGGGNSETEEEEDDTSSEKETNNSDKSSSEKNNSGDQDNSEQEEEEEEEETIDPPQVSLTQAPPEMTSSTQAAFKIRAQNASTTYYKLNGEKATTSTSTIELKDLTEGEYEFTAVATNTFATNTTSHTWTIDTKNPAPPTLSLGPKNNGYYWVTGNNVQLSGEKDKDVSEIVIKTSISSSSVSLATGTDTWSIDHNLSFRCPTTSIYNLSNCSYLDGKMGSQERFKQALKTFHKKELDFQARDIWGRYSSTTRTRFRLDNAPPEILTVNEKHSETYNRILLLSGLTDDLFSSAFQRSPMGPSLDNVHLASGIKKKTWQYRTNINNNWQNASTREVEIDNYQLDLFRAEFGRDYDIRLRLKDHAGHIATSAPEDMIKIEMPTSSYPVISEIYANASTTDHGGEWIELYNPSGEDISLKNYAIDTATYEDDVKFPATSTIPAHSFFLIGDENWTPDKNDWPDPDLKTKITLDDSGGWVRLKGGQGREVDYVEYNEINPLNSKERKAYLHSTQQKMSLGGTHHDLGNGWDTNDSIDDFITKDNPEPQNSSSTPEKWEF